MSKKALKTYLKSLPKAALEEQLLALYGKFVPVKTYYDFIFNPREEKLIQEAKTKISNEYFPLNRKKPKARRSVAQKHIKHFITLGMEPSLIADVMCYNIEIAQTYALEGSKPDTFYKSIGNSFTEMTQFVAVNSLLPEFKARIINTYNHTQTANWPFGETFSKALDILD